MDEDRNAPEKRGLTRKQIAAVAAGNALDFYDFLTYAFFAAQIGRALFPSGGGNGLLLSLATFGVGFVTRPLGGLVIGRLADRRGRRPAMLLSFSLMGAAILGLALTPPFAAIGWAAPVLAVAFRMLQGFALGGEVGPNTAYLIEAAPPGRQGRYISVQYATQDLAILVSGSVGLRLATTLTPAQLDAWGWRVAFLLGAAIIPFALAIRRTLTETLRLDAPDQIVAGRGLARAASAGLLMLGALTIAGYTLDYLTTYAQETLHMPVGQAFGATVVLGGTAVVADLAAGWLCDRIGARRVLLLPWLLLTVLAAPAFALIAAWRTPAALFGATATLSILLELAAVPAMLIFARALPPRARAGSLGLVYAVAIAAFGGSAQLVEAALIRWTADPIAPAWYATTALGVGLIGIFLLRERRLS